MTAAPPAIIVARGLLAELLGRAAAEPAREICGLLLGTPGCITHAPAAANVAADPARSFEIDPAALLAAHKAARAGGPAILGCYHSHPNGDPTPSPRDRAAAEPGRLWLLVAGGEARLWRAGADGFRAVPLIVG